MTVGSTRKYGVKPLPKSRRSRRVCLLVGTSTACVAICTYPFTQLSTSRVPSSKKATCNYTQSDLPMGTGTYIDDLYTKVISHQGVSVLHRYPTSSYALHRTICSLLPAN